MKNSLLRICLSGWPAILISLTLRAEVPGAPIEARYGLFNGLDHRSEYGQGIYPEPFLVDDSDLEQGEARLDWLHTRGKGGRTDVATAEVEKGFGLLTLELEIPYERDVSDGAVLQGAGNVNVSARAPFLQFVSAHGFADATFGVALEAGVPTHSSVSRNAELVPKLFNDLKLGRFTMQSVLGYSTLFGSGEVGGLETFEYGFVLGYAIERRHLPIPGVQRFIPVFEFAGETELNKDDPGRNSLLGNAGFRINLNAVGPIQPRLGLGFVFPVDKGARNDVHSGIITSLVFEY